MRRTIAKLESKLVGTDSKLDWEHELVLDNLLQLSVSRMDHLEGRDLTRPTVVAARLQEHCRELEVSAELLAGLVQRDPLLLLLHPLELQARLTLLGSVLQLPHADAVLRTALQFPTLLACPSSKLAKRLTELDALFKSRGLSLQSLARRQPDLLVQAPGSLRLKMDAIPAALDLPPRRARDVMARCPQLLRRSPATVHERFRVLQDLFDSVPRNFLSELVLQEPKVLCLSSATLAAKFATLTRKYGSFQDDVVDMILVDPNVFLSAPVDDSAAGGRAQRPRATHGTAPTAARRAGARRSPLPAGGVSHLLRVAGELAVPLECVLEACADGSDMCEWGPGVARARIDGLARVLGLGLDATVQLARAQPRLLELQPHEVQARVQALRELLGQQSAEGGAVADATRAQDAPAPDGAEDAPASSDELELLLRHPSLLLAEPSELRSRAGALAGALALPVDRLPALLRSAPGLVAQPPAAIAEQVGRLCALLGGVASSLAAEMITREPRLLSTPASELEDAFEQLCLSFGSFRQDAIDVCMADPSMLIRRSSSGGGATGSGADGDEDEDMSSGEMFVDDGVTGARDVGGVDAPQERRRRKGSGRRRDSRSGGRYL